MIEILNQVNIYGTYIKTVNPIYNKPTDNIILNNERLKPFPLRFGTQECPLLSVLFNIILNV